MDSSDEMKSTHRQAHGQSPDDAIWPCGSFMLLFVVIHAAVEVGLRIRCEAVPRLRVAKAGSGASVVTAKRARSRLGIGGITVCLLLFSMGCEAGPRSGRGLRLPEGNLARGKAAFYELECSNCHSIAGEQPPPREEEPYIDVVLGGRVLHIATHGELVTSIVNPSHGLPAAQPRRAIAEAGVDSMPEYGQIMTVQQLIDLTAFLQSKYELETPPPLHLE